MKRSPMRRARKNRLRAKSKTNSQKHDNPEDRQPYLDQYHVCEIIHLFPKYGYIFAQIPLRGGIVHSIRVTQSPVCVHHVGSGIRGNGRWDYPWNFAAVCETSHWFCESQWGGYPEDGFVLCRKAKVDSGTWDETEMAKFIGCDHTLEWLSTRKIEHEFARLIFEEMCSKELK